MQMPPADFFSAASSDDEDDEDDEDEGEREGEDEGDGKYVSPQIQGGNFAPAQGRFELLDVAEKLLLSRGNAARRNLEVHYRSRPIELIAFSNHAFYDGKLQSAPYNDSPPKCMKRPIEMEKIDGNFVNSINREEINAVIEKLRAIWDINPPPSVGVIVFNTTQATALKNTINNMCDNDTDFKEKYDNANRADEDSAFFIRSVENVQGDERDIIILATTYDGKSGRFFGPISTFEYGRRRLNVAITRAKRGMFIITSLKIDHIAHSGERPDDVAQEGKTQIRSDRWYLWRYMCYAHAVSNSEGERAKEILKDINRNYKPRPTGRGPDSQFEIDVAEFLRNEGYHVDYQIGEGGFRIDLGVKKEERHTRYLCGVECDGRTWHSGWRARHNDIWRQGILKDKGWEIVRIWNDEYYTEEGGNKLLDKIRAVEQKLMQKMSIK